MACTKKIVTPTQPTIANAFAARNEVVSPAGSTVINIDDLSNSSDTSVPPVVRTIVTKIDLHLALDRSMFPVIQERIADNWLVYRAADPTTDSNIKVYHKTNSILTTKKSKTLIESQTKWSSFGSAKIHRSMFGNTRLLTYNFHLLAPSTNLRTYLYPV